MAPSSGTFPKLDEHIRPFLLEGRSEWHSLLLLATFVVAVGVVLEIWEICKDVREEWDHNTGSKPKRASLVLSSEGVPFFEHRRSWVKTIGAVGWLLVVLGVVGEFWFDSVIADFDIGLRVIDDEVLRQSRLDTLDASIGAALATQEAAQADARARSEIDARLTLEKDVLWKGPRDVLLSAAQSRFDNRLRRFGAQRFRNSVCALMIPGGGIADETAGTENTLGSVLRHAGWTEVSSYPNVPAAIPLTLFNCVAHGITVNERPGRPETTGRAARALSLILNGILSEWRRPGVGVIGPTAQQSQLPADVVEIMVGVHMPHKFQ